MINRVALARPFVLKSGDVIGVVSPSSGLASQVPHRVEQAVAMLEKMQFRVKFAPHALQQSNYTSGSPKDRAQDINELFRDPSVKAIVTTIGGNHSNQILEHLDYAAIRKNPKIFLGFSDITVLHLALYAEASLMTFYGPALLTQFGENPEILPYTKEYFLRALCQTSPIGVIDESPVWTDELLNWLAKEDMQRPRKLFQGRQRIGLKSGSARGRLMGGCITSLQHLRGTKYWPEWEGCLFFWDIPESQDFRKGVSVDRIDSLLIDLDLSGVFQKIAGMIVGRPYGYTDEEEIRLRDVILERVAKYDFPILYNVELGHSDPVATIPVGALAEIDSEKKYFGILESGVITHSGST